MDRPGTPTERKQRAQVFLSNVLTAPEGTGLSLTTEVDVRYQDFFEEFPESAQLVGTTMSLEFLPEQSRTRFHLEGLDLVEGASQTTLDLDLLDQPDGSLRPLVRKLTGSINADLLMEVLRVPLPGFNFKGAQADYEVTDLRLTR